MEIEQKKYIIEHIIKLGMDKYSSYLLAECSEDEINTIENDLSYQKELDIIQKSYEKELLTIYNKHMELCALKGNLGPTQWMLSKINPDRWGNGIQKIKQVNMNVNNLQEQLSEEEKKRIEEEFDFMFIERKE